MFAGLFRNDFGYQFLYLLHIVLVVVGFGSSFVYPALAARARKLAPAEGYAVNHAALSLSKILTTYPIWGAGLVGIVLVGVSEEWEFSQQWVSIAFILFIVGIGVASLVHSPNLKKMDVLQERLVSGAAAPPAAGGPPAEVGELEMRGKRAAMTGGILHLVFLLLVIDMIWKPGI